MKYCSKCGKEIMEDAVICPGCGCSTGYIPVNPQNSQDLINELSNKIKTNGIIWICIASLQIILGLTVQWVLFIIGILNLVSGIQDISFGNNIVQKPIGIIKRFEPLTGPIIVFIYNLIFGGVIGVIGSIYYLVAIRSFVLTNKPAFEAIEAQAQAI